ncbi:hypothetical protein BD779DRAFT_1486582 [Infundibulicybe gibba]|nr:hypothetical protein BD779DRAFT_1486582 [Infundibulicybe gibba]
MSSAFINSNRAAGVNAYYRSATAYLPQPVPQRPVADVRDDYERWYTESIPSNRMTLSLRSGIHSEVGWSLDRLCRLCHNEQFQLKSIPGVIDALFEWPEWYATEGFRQTSDADILFSPPPEQARQRRYALESLFVLRNAALHEQNAFELSNHSHTIPLIMNAFQNLDFDRDENTEFILHIIDLLHVVSPKLILTPFSTFNPLPYLSKIASQSSNRTSIIASLTATNLILSNASNISNLTSDSSAMTAAIRYLPSCRQTADRGQDGLEEKVTLDVSGSIHTVSSMALGTRDHELTKEEFDGLLQKPEPERCYDWMRTMFVAKVDGELTQVDFWNLYKDVFSPYQEQYPLLVASDVIKNVNLVFPQAQAMVLQGPVQRFVVRGVDRRKDSCPAPAFTSLAELCDHLFEHLAAAESSDFPCLWSTCSKPPLPKPALRSHVLTHLSVPDDQTKPPSQSDTITLPSEDSPYPIANPTARPPPPPRNTVITFERPTIDPPSSSLTALLCIRIIFRTSFASSDVAPRVDADHFGFPGVVEETDEQDSLDLVDGESSDNELEGERRGRKAFTGIRRLLEGVRIRDEALMGWVTEMVDAGISGIS